MWQVKEASPQWDTERWRPCSLGSGVGAAGACDYSGVICKVSQAPRRCFWNKGSTFWASVRKTFPEHSLAQFPDRMSNHPPLHPALQPSVLISSHTSPLQGLSPCGYLHSFSEHAQTGSPHFSPLAEKPARFPFCQFRLR